MAKKGSTPEQIIHKLREAEVLLNQGATIARGYNGCDYDLKSGIAIGVRSPEGFMS